MNKMGPEINRVPERKKKSWIILVIGMLLSVKQMVLAK